MIDLSRRVLWCNNFWIILKQEQSEKFKWRIKK